MLKNRKIIEEEDDRYKEAVKRNSKRKQKNRGKVDGCGNVEREDRE